MLRLALKVSVVLSLVLLFGQIALADQLILKNGDRLTGEMVSMEGGKLSFKTAYAGTLTIPWTEVENFKTDKPVELYVADHGHVTGQVTGGQNGTITVVDANNATETKNMADIKGLNKDPDRIRWMADVNLAWNKAQGNTNKESFHLDASLMVEQDKNRYKGYAEMNQATDKGKRSDNNWKVMAEYDRFLNKKIFLDVNGMLQHDAFQDIKLMQTAGVGVGYQFFNTDDIMLSASVGPSYVTYDYDGHADQSFFAGRWAVNFSWWVYKRYAQVYHNEFGLVSATNSNNWTMQTRTGVRFPVFKNFYTGFQFDWDWKNQPVHNKRQWDERYMWTVGYHFE